VTCAGVFASARAAANPANPPPTINTLGTRFDDI
jgi:hypothetical protein